ncbi:MAG: DUF378 domain-containing protein [Oscillospiraceae bacterium]|jgi:uncharacterized membrane protein YuzA (DUF378 family)|nr:DUF378 domain-containing protein [Oscillospiraceae bacterium]
MLDRISLLLAIIGGLNWGILGIFGFNFLGWIFGGTDSVISRIVFTLVGLAAIWCISLLFRERDVLSHQSSRTGDRDYY